RRGGMTFDFIQNNLDRLLQLRIMSLTPRSRIEFHFHVRWHPFVLPVQLAGLGVKNTPARSRDQSAIDEPGRTANTNQPSPSAGTDQRAGAQPFEHPGEGVSP